jgi:hypothetical protein
MLRSKILIITFEEKRWTSINQRVSFLQILSPPLIATWNETRVEAYFEVTLFFNDCLLK